MPSSITSSVLDDLYDALAEWAHDHGLSCKTRDLPGDGVHRDRKLTIAGKISVEFTWTQPRVVVEWGDGYRGDFAYGLPVPALTGLIAGFLGHTEDRDSARFADLYSVRYGDVGSGGRALIVETDEPMQIRPTSDRKVIIARA